MTGRIGWRPAGIRILGAVLMLWPMGASAKNKDVMPEVAEAARTFAPFAGPVAWESEAGVEAADLIEFAGPDRVFVGTVAVTSKTGVPEHGPLLCLDAKSGRKLWSVPRPAMPTGQFTLLHTGPLLVLLGRDDRTLEVLGLDAETGAKRWGARAAAPAEARVAGQSLLLLSQPDRTLRCVDVASGNALWTRPLEGLGPERTLSLTVGDGIALAAGTAFSLSDGQPRWKLEREDGETPLVVPGGIALWGPRGAALVDTADGRVRWERRVPDPRTVEAAFADGDALYLLSDGPAPADDVLEALDEASGKPRWSKPLKDEAASQILVHGNLVCLSGEAAVMAFRKANGALAFRTPFKPMFQAARPSAAAFLGAPDRLLVRGSTLVAWRERAGLQAFALPGGAPLWTQAAYGDAPEFTSDEAALLLKTTREILQQQRAAYDKNLDKARTGLKDLQRQADEARTQQASYAATALSMVGAAQVWREARRQAAAQGLGQRFILTADAVLGRPARAIQGRYFLDPFIAKSVGRGLTVVDLDRGLRSDFLYAPLVAPLLDYSVDLLAFTLDPSQTKLLAVGVGFDPARHQPLEKWGFRLPRPSLFAFDIGKLRFDARNTLREKAVSIYEASLVKALGEGPTALANAAAGGLTESVRILLDAGGDPNSLYPSGHMTALHLAAFNGHLPVVELLVKRGADVNRTNDQGKTPLDLALMPQAGEGPALRAKRQAVADTLRAAGGKSAAPPPPTGAVADLHRAIQDDDAAAFQAALAKGISIEAVHDGETPLTRALRERRSRMAAELRRRGCSLTAPGAYGLTPLHYASMQLDLELMRACLAAKADVNAASTRGETPLMAILRPFTPFGGEPMLQAVELLLENGADPNRKEVVTGKQTLLQVAKSIDARLARALSKHGAK